METEYQWGSQPKNCSPGNLYQPKSPCQGISLAILDWDRVNFYMWRVIANDGFFAGCKSISISEVKKIYI